MYAIFLPLMAALMLAIWFMVTSLAAFLQESLGRDYSILSAATTVFVGLMVTIGALGGRDCASAFLWCAAGICLGNTRNSAGTFMPSCFAVSKLMANLRSNKIIQLTADILISGHETQAEFLNYAVSKLKLESAVTNSRVRTRLETDTELLILHSPTKATG